MTRLDKISVSVLTQINPYIISVFYLQSDPKTSIELSSFIIHDPTSNKLSKSRSYIIKSAALRSIDRSSESLNDSNAALALTPTLPDAYLSVGNSYLAMKMQDKAIYYYKRAIDYDNCFSAAYYNLGNVYADQGNFLESELQYRYAVYCSKNMKLAYLNLGTVLHDRNDFKSAIAAFKTALAIDHNYEAAYINLGRVYFEEKNFSDAIASFEKAKQIAPKDPEPLEDMGKTLYLMGDLEYALEVFKSANATKSTARGHVNLANVLQAIGNNEDAVQEYRLAIQLEYNNVTAHLDLAIILIHAGRIHDGEVELRYVVFLDPNNAQAHYNLGQSLKMQGDYDGAIAECTKATEIAPKDSTFQHELSDLHQTLNQRRRIELQNKTH